MKHGLWGTTLYVVWRGMMTRCYDMASPSFVFYGAEGITVCRRWWRVENFAKDMGPRPKGTVLDRIDGSKGYSPNNCRWTTQSANCRNKKNNVLVEYEGKKVTLIEASERSGISHELLTWRLKNGWTNLFAPVRRWRKK